MRFDLLTLFPGMFQGYLAESLLEKAISAGLVEVHLHDFRQWTDDKHHSVDDRPFGGGPGMVLKVEPVVRCVEDVQKLAGSGAAHGSGVSHGPKGSVEGPGSEDASPGHVVMLTPQGEPLRQPLVEQLAQHSRLVLLCGRYEGFDERVSEILQPQEISIGDYILNGGETAAMVLIDAVIRLRPGVLGDEQSSHDDSFSTGNRLLEYPQYTRPRSFRGHDVPDVLLSGDHQAVAKWREQQSQKRTEVRRPDLM